jgi:hypothetical protein
MMSEETIDAFLALQEPAANDNIEIRLSEQPDGFGFFYSEARKGDQVVRVNIMPPEYLWAGCIMLDEHRPDPKMWTVYADGQLIARIARQEDVGPALLPLLTAR